MIPYSNVDRDDELDHVVLWNGTRHAESGTAYLDAVEETRREQQPPRPVYQETLTARVVRALRQHGPQTVTALHVRLGAPRDEVSARIVSLRTRGFVEATGQRVAKPGRVMGRNYELVYGLVEKDVDTARVEA